MRLTLSHDVTLCETCNKVTPQSVTISRTILNTDNSFYLFIQTISVSYQLEQVWQHVILVTYNILIDTVMSVMDKISNLSIFILEKLKKIFNTNL